MTTQIIAECLTCGTQSPFIPGADCPHCHSINLEVRYPLDEIRSQLPGQLASRPFDLWRYRELLPVQSPKIDISLYEGGTPLIRATNLGMMLGMQNLFIKDERRGPTHSFKDRQAAVTIATLKEAGITEMVVASTGNVAIAFSAYAARAGIKLWAFLTSMVPSEKMREVALYGTQVIKVTGSYDQAKQIAAAFAKQRGIFLDAGAHNLANVEAMKTIAFEVSEQLSTMKGLPPGQWTAPDWYLQSVSGGMGPLGVLKGFEEMQAMGWVDCLPKVGILQVEGCAPMVHAWKQGRAEAVPVQSPRTLIATLATGDPGSTYTNLYHHMRQGAGGTCESVTDEEAFRTMHILAKMEGISVEPAAAVAFAGLIKLVREGVIHPHDTVVVNCTGHTMAIERNLLGEGWARDVVLSSQQMQESPEEGLLAALSKVNLDRFPRIAIVDDNPDVRRLIRRILQAQGNYTLFEACNGQEAIELAKNERPNLMILDLMMPGVDGFSVIQSLQSNPETADIPVIVVTAKELTPAEKTLLHGRIQTLMQKGNFMSDELLDEVRALLG